MHTIYERAILSDKELEDFTGYKRPHDQKAMLDRLGVPYSVRPDGKPRTTYGLIEKGLCRQTERPRFHKLRG